MALRAGNEWAEYGCDDDDFKRYVKEAWFSFICVLPLLVVVSIGGFEAGRKHMLGTHHEELVPTPSPLPPSSNDYYGQWWVILVCIVLATTTVMMLPICKQPNDDDNKKVGCLWFWFCLVP